MSLKTNEELIGSRIRSIRKEKNMSQQKLAKLSEVSATVLSATENQKRTPGLIVLTRIASALEVSLDELVYGEKSERPISTAKDDAETIVNCFSKLYELGVLDYVQKLDQLNDEGKHPRFLRVSKVEPQIINLFYHLQDIEKNKDTLPDPEKMRKDYMQSVATQIRNLEKQS